MRRHLATGLAVAGLLAVPGVVSAHDLDHPAPNFTTDAPLSTAFNSGGEDAEWELVTSFPTGNPHTDLDFFTQDGDTYASVGTLAAGPNGAGQTVVRLTENGEVDPQYVSGHPSATCPSNPEAALGLQHDIEAAPKGRALLNTRNPEASREDTEILVDASDANGRCHDGGLLGFEDPLGILPDVPQGGLEIIDITNPEAPAEIGLTSHIGEAHTVNVDPRRPHIAYAVTSDRVGVEEVDGDFRRVNGEPDDTPAQREAAYESGDELNLDGFEIVDMSSCMGFPEGASLERKRRQCRPEVFRYRFPEAETALGHTLQDHVYGCHELEVYPNDRLTCGSGNAAIVFNMRRAFHDNGTPEDFSDDTVNGEALPCRVRESTSTQAFDTGAKVTDCVVGEDANGGPVDLSVPGWLDEGAPSVAGVRHVGSAHHMGRGATSAENPVTAYPSDEDIDFDHELEFTQSRDFVIATDERGGGVTPPGATCTPGVDNEAGNGGFHAYAVDRLDTELPGSAQEAWDAYARTPQGDKAIYRVPVRTEGQVTVCTAHVFQQIPGQNRIFMGWYSQGTQVVDYVEHEDGTFEFREAGWFIPENANTWVSHVFKVERNDDGTFTYWGATGDFNLGESGRNAIDIYRVTLPPPPGTAGEEPPPEQRPRCDGRRATIVAEPGGTTRGTERDDVIVGTARGDEIRARGGNDLVCARAGKDRVGGGSGGDELHSGRGGGRLAGGAGPDEVRGQAGDDRLVGNEARDSLHGRQGDDVLRGGAARDRCNGGSGSDSLISCET